MVVIVVVVGIVGVRVIVTMGRGIHLVRNRELRVGGGHLCGYTRVEEYDVESVIAMLLLDAGMVDGMDGKGELLG